VETRRQNDVAGVVKLANQHPAEPTDRLDAIIRGERLALLLNITTVTLVEDGFQRAMLVGIRAPLTGTVTGHSA
jgi:hypothetical protein